MTDSLNYFFSRKDIKFLILCLIIALYYFHSFGKFDILPSDDDVYFHTGLLFELPYKTFGNLLYPLGIYVFSKIFSNPILLTYSYLFFMSSIMFLAMVSFLKKYLNNFYLALFISIAFLFSGFQVSLLPRITILNLIFGLIYLTLIDFKRPRHLNWGITSVGLMLCNYVSRPEFFWFFLIAALLFLYFTVTARRATKKHKITVIGAFLGFVALFYFIGGGINEPAKLKVAYIQHFFDNYQVWTGQHFDYEEEFVVFENVYGKVESTLDIITANPSYFFKHVFTNLKTYFLLVLEILKSCFYDYLLVLFKFKTKFAFAALILLLAFELDLKQTVKKFWIKLKSRFFILPFLILFMLPTFVAVLIIFPRDHYTILHLPFYFLIIGIFIDSFTWKRKRVTENITRISALLFLALLVFNLQLKMPEKSHRQYYEFMNALPLKNVKLLSNDVFGLNYYQNGQYTRTGWDPQNNELTDKLNSGKFDILSIYFMDLETKSNREFTAEGYKKTGYVKIERFKGIQRYLFVRPEYQKYFEN
jgi:hypothetical protein